MNLHNVDFVSAFKSVTKLLKVKVELSLATVELGESNGDGVEGCDGVHEIVGFVDNDDAVFKVDAEGFAGRLLEEKLIWERYYLSGSDCFSRGVVWTDSHLLAKFGEIFDVSYRGERTIAEVPYNRLFIGFWQELASLRLGCASLL